jgi:hypothetical protein
MTGDSGKRDVKLTEQIFEIRTWLSEAAYQELGGDDPEDARVAELRADVDSQVRQGLAVLEARLREQFAAAVIEVDERG